MTKAVLVFLSLSLASNAWGDMTCRAGKQAACLDGGDIVCPASSKCIDESAVCYAEAPCAASGGFICASRYEAIVKESGQTAQKYKLLVTENTKLRVKRLERKNCVLNATTLTEAQKCVR